MTSIFPSSRRTSVEVFQVDHGSILEGILNGHNATASRQQHQRSNPLAMMKDGSDHSSSSSTSRSGRRGPSSPSSSSSPTRKTTNKAKLALTQEDKKRLVVGSALVSSKKKPTARLQQMFSTKKTT